ncbi:MAG: hypothetical protein PHH00_02290 [Candidatus Nanoarchaeia archaeon]|nr:hypothetical protein [Candidatus Nanoarchaeia archaeon]
MHKKSLQILFLFLLILLSLNFLSSSDSQLYQSCGGDSQTTIGCLGDAEFSFSGSATSTQTSTSAPTLEITKPKNQTYINGTNLKVQVETDGDYSWYNLDNGQNKTIYQSKAYFNADEGTHTIYVFANNSAGVTAKNVTFTVNTAKFEIKHGDFGGSDRGGTTNFSEYSYEEMQNISDVVLEKTGKGKIKFIEKINFTDDINPADSAVDLDSNVIISFNKIEINSSALPNFNKTATLSLYDLTFTNPQILMDGSVCPDSICTEGTYAGGTLEFTVTHFTTYSTQETPGAAVTAQTTSGGGGGYDCYTNTECKTPGYGVCWNHECIARLFDVKILGFESPIELGDFFAFTYSLKDMANVDGDVDIDFWIEKDGKNITSGSEVVFVGGLEEIEYIEKLFIPEDIESGDYIFYIQVSNTADIATIHRTIQIVVDNEEGIATIVPVPENENSRPVITLFSVIICILTIMIIILLMYLKQVARRKGAQNIIQGLYGPYFKLRLKFKIFISRLTNPARRRKRHKKHGKRRHKNS